MNINSAFPSKYLKSSDIDEDVTVTIKGIDLQNVAKQGEKQEMKPVVSFHELDKPLVCNKTNARMIAKITGSDDTDDWAGKKVRLIATEVEFQGELVVAIRVREPKRKSPIAPAASAAASQDSDEPPF